MQIKGFFFALQFTGPSKKRNRNTKGVAPTRKSRRVIGRQGGPTEPSNPNEMSGGDLAGTRTDAQSQSPGTAAQAGKEPGMQDLVAEGMYF